VKWELVAVIVTGTLFLFLGLGLGVYARKRHVTSVETSSPRVWVRVERMSFVAGILGALVALLTALPALADLFASPQASPSTTTTPNSTDSVFAPGLNIGEPMKPAGTKQWINTFADAPGWRCANNACKSVGILKSGRNYIFCKKRNSQLSVGKDHNHWWMWADLDTGGQGWVSAYYLKGQGNDQAKDIYGRQLPTCA
jgi:hypothetical protein